MEHVGVDLSGPGRKAMSSTSSVRPSMASTARNGRPQGQPRPPNATQSDISYRIRGRAREDSTVTHRRTPACLVRPVVPRRRLGSTTRRSSYRCRVRNVHGEGDPCRLGRGIDVVRCRPPRLGHDLGGGPGQDLGGRHDCLRADPQRARALHVEQAQSRAYPTRRRRPKSLSAPICSGSGAVASRRNVGTSRDASDAPATADWCAGLRRETTAILSGLVSPTGTPAQSFALA